jgi:hypothetical protein
MRLSIDLDTLAVSDYTGSAVQTLSARRGDAFPVQVRFTQGGVAQELPHAATGRLSIKNALDYSGGLVAGSAGWRKVGHGVAAYYIFPLNLATEQIAEAFLSLSGELAQVSFVLEIEWSHRGVRRTSRSVAFVVDNDYSRPGDELPTALTPLPPTI